jgi:hypothetical protein
MSHRRVARIARRGCLPVSESLENARPASCVSPFAGHIGNVVSSRQHGCDQSAHVDLRATGKTCGA